ncbi:MAG: RluA family pseudouridine synthase [Beijerinckiaceae bacterium]|nr:RluA family pseudouridine synthase [Beijerinckiaceae bacterium]
MSAVTTRTIKPDEDGMRVDRWFKERFPELPFGALQRMIRSGQIRVSGGRIKTSTRLEAGQIVRIPPMDAEPGRAVEPAGIRVKGEGAGKAGASNSARREPTKAAFAHKADHVAGRGARADGEIAKPLGLAARRQMQSDLDFLKSIILYEDKEMMVLNKPMGLAVQGGPGTTRHVDGLLEAMRDEDGQKPRLVHRLDKDTAGCLIIAKTRLAAAALAKTFRSRSARKIYWALVAGVPRVRQGRVSTYLAKGEGRDGVEKMKIAKHGDEGADHALTYYAVVDQAAQKLAWLSLKPVTGRTHQLRAHAAHIGHPIVGDPKYFDIENWELPGGIQKKLHLLARRIVIPHPKTGKPVDVSAPLPPHMQQSWNLLGLDASQYDPIVDAPEE